MFISDISNLTTAIDTTTNGIMATDAVPADTVSSPHSSPADAADVVMRNAKNSPSYMAKNIMKLPDEILILILSYV